MPGVRDRDVEAAELLDRLRDRGVDLVTVGDVALEPRRVAAVGGDVGEQLRLDPEQRDPRAALVQARASSAPIPRAAPVIRPAGRERARLMRPRPPSAPTIACSTRTARGGGPAGSSSGSTSSALSVIASIS